MSGMASEDTKYACVRYEGRYRDAWDDLVLGSQQHSILHSRAFLDYHGERFEDRSLVFLDKSANRVVGVLPAALHPSRTDMVASHPGSTFGGLLLRHVEPTAFRPFFDMAAEFYRASGVTTLRYKTTPSFVARQPDETELQHGLRHGSLVGSDLWSVVRLNDFRFHQKRRASITAAERKGVTVRQGTSTPDWQAFHDMLQINLRERHDTAPVHDFDELLDVNARLAERSQLYLADTKDGNLGAGVWLIDYGQGSIHTQYIASTAEGRNAGAVDLVLARAIEDGAAKGFRNFSFGVSAARDGELNEGLLRFKLRFDAGVVVHMIFDYDLQSLYR